MNMNLDLEMEMDWISNAYHRVGPIPYTLWQTSCCYVVVVVVVVVVVILLQLIYPLEPNFAG
jgi:uncharacterized membrane protein YhdT